MIGVVIVLHLLILWILEFSPSPEFMIFPYLARLGWVPYREIVDHHFPGIFFAINWNLLGFVTAKGLHFLLLAVVGTTSAFIYFLTKKFYSQKAALLSVIIFAFWQPIYGGSILWIDLFLPLLLLPALYFLLSKKWFLAGLLLGLAILCKQNTILLVIPSAIVAFRNGKKGAIFFGGLIVPAIYLLIKLIVWQNWDDFWFWNVVFNLKHYATLAGKFPSFNDLLKLIPPFIFILPVLYSKISHKWVFGSWILVLLLGFAPRFGLEHFQASLPFMVILVAEFISQQRAKVMGFALGLGILSTGWFYLAPQPYLQTRYFDQETLEVVQYVLDNTTPGDTIFLLGAQPHIYALTNTVPPGRYFTFHMPWLLKFNGDKALEAVSNNPPKLVIFDINSRVDGLSIRQYANFLVEYVEGSYQRIESIGGYSIYASRN